MSAHNYVRVTFNIMLAQIAVLVGSVALVAAGSSQTSVSNLHGGSYTYGVDHDNYGAWYGTADPYGLGGVASGHGISSLYGHGALNHGPLSHGDVSYGFETYGAGFGYGDKGQATSYQNYNLNTIGGEKILHSSHGVNHGHGATSYQSIYQKTGSGLYGGSGGDYGYSHGNYAGGYGHETYSGGISSQNFHLKSHVHQPNSYDVSSHYVQNYYSPISSYGHGALGDTGSYGDYSGSYGHDYKSYNRDYSSSHAQSYGDLHDLGNLGYSGYDDGYSGYGHGYNGYGHGYSGYGHGYNGYGHGYSGYGHGYNGYGHGYSGYGHEYVPSYSGLSFYK